jgi:hypothetical protein
LFSSKIPEQIYRDEEGRALWKLFCTCLNGSISHWRYPEKEFHHDSTCQISCTEGPASTSTFFNRGGRHYQLEANAEAPCPARRQSPDLAAKPLCSRNSSASLDFPPARQTFGRRAGGLSGEESCGVTCASLLAVPHRLESISKPEKSITKQTRVETIEYS